jgi:hypothetical protein
VQVACLCILQFDTVHCPDSRMDSLGQELRKDATTMSCGAEGKVEISAQDPRTPEIVSAYMLLNVVSD